MGLRGVLMEEFKIRYGERGADGFLRVTDWQTPGGFERLGRGWMEAKRAEFVTAEDVRKTTGKGG